VVDLGFHAFDEFFKMTDEIGFLKEAIRAASPRRSVRGDIDRSSAAGYSMLQQQIPPNALIAIDNEHWCAANCPPPWDGDAWCRISALPVFLKTYIDRLTFSFTTYLRNEKDSSTELHQWIRSELHELP